MIGCIARPSSKRPSRISNDFSSETIFNSISIIWKVYQTKCPRSAKCHFCYIIKWKEGMNIQGEIGGASPCSSQKFPPEAETLVNYRERGE